MKLNTLNFCDHTVILTGSRAKRDSNEDSDIDLLALSDTTSIRRSTRKGHGKNETDQETLPLYGAFVLLCENITTDDRSLVNRWIQGKPICETIPGIHASYRLWMERAMSRYPADADHTVYMHAATADHNVSDLLRHKQDIVLAAGLLSSMTLFIAAVNGNPSLGLKNARMATLGNKDIQRLADIFRHCCAEENFSNLAMEARGIISRYVSNDMPFTTGLTYSTNDYPSLCIYIPTSSLDSFLKEDDIRKDLESVLVRYPHHSFLAKRGDGFPEGLHIYVVPSDKRLAREKLDGVLKRHAEACLKSGISIVYPFRSSFPFGWTLGGKIALEALLPIYESLNRIKKEGDVATLTYSFTASLLLALPNPPADNLSHNILRAYRFRSADPNCILGPMQANILADAIDQIISRERRRSIKFSPAMETVARKLSDILTSFPERHLFLPTTNPYGSIRDMFIFLAVAHAYLTIESDSRTIYYTTAFLMAQERQTPIP